MPDGKWLADAGSLEVDAIPAYRDAVAWGSDAMIGTPRSATAIPLGYLSHVDDVPLISYWAFTTILSNPSVFPLFTRTNPDSGESARAVHHLIRTLQYEFFSVAYQVRAAAQHQQLAFATYDLLTRAACSPTG